MKTYRITPQDVLFFRDARPMTAGEGSGGHGGRLPEPSVIFDALHRALHQTFPEPQPWEKPVDNREVGRNGMPLQRFGSLNTAGIFPCRADHWFFPCPADVTRAVAGKEAGTLALMEMGHDATNLPKPLTHVAAPTTPPSKEPVPAWWTKPAWEAYLNDTPLPAHSLFPLSELAATEWRTGIGIADATGTQDGESIYSAEYLRLRPDVELGFAAGIQSASDADVLEALRHAAPSLTIGGQQRVSRMELLEKKLGALLPLSAPISASRVKWVLLTPAIFPANEPHPGGWLPNWIHPESREVLLKTARPSNKRSYVWKDGKRRDVRVAASIPINARLIAARIPKPIVLTGFSRRENLAEKERLAGPRETLLAVPAGAVFYFEAGGANEEEKATNAQALASALSWHGENATPETATTIRHRRSTLWGEKGYGLGVCGTWKTFDETRKP